jgi:hypothetical protein
MRKQRHAAAFERRAQFWFGDEPVDSEFHDWIGWGKAMRKAIGIMEIRPSQQTLQRSSRVLTRAFPVVRAPVDKCRPVHEQVFV